MSVYSSNTLNSSNPNDAWVKIAKFIGPKKRILDIGCSSGNLGQALKKTKQSSVVGIDIDSEDVKLAQKNLDAAYQLDVEQDDLKPLGKFDVIIMADVIEHLVDPVEALKKVKKLIKPSGRLVFSIPNMANVTVRLELLKGRFEYKDIGLLDRTHLHFYDQTEVEHVFQSADYQIKQFDCTVRNIPDYILKTELRKIGLDLTPTFQALLNKPEAFIYQFVGYATPVAKATTHAEPTTTSPLDSITQEIDSLNRKHQDEVARKNQEIHRLNEKVHELEAGREEAKTHLNEILNSKAWKLALKLRAARLKVVPKRHPK